MAIFREMMSFLTKDVQSFPISVKQLCDIFDYIAVYSST